MDVELDCRNNIDFVGTKLIRPTGAVPARWIGAIGNTGLVQIRFWKVDPVTCRNTPVQIAARYCPTHCILYLDSDYPLGCPECNPANGPG